MELRQYISIIKKSLIWIIVITILGGTSGLLVAITTTEKFDTSLSFNINRINKQETTEYQYDGYYAIQAADLFAKTVTSWLATPSILLEIYDEAGIDPRVDSLTSFASRFTTKKYSSQNIGVRFKERDRVTAEKIAAAIIDVLQEKTTNINQTADAKSLFEIVGSTPVIVATKPSIAVLTIVGLVAGFFVVFMMVLIIYYLRVPPSSNEDRY
ncbi:hypothetical protein ACFL04_04040 [Patescibacteria group bacterium]